MKHFIAFLFLLYCNTCLAQPVITSVSPNAASVGSLITISGSNFENTASNNVIFFGATKATVISASATSLRVSIPAEATYGRISLTANGFTCFSPFPFNVISGQSLNDSSFNSKVDFTCGTYPSLIARGDFDGDGRPDMVVSNFSSSNISVFRNTCSPGSISFAAASNYITAVEPEGIDVDDINGDGKPDIIVTSISGHLFSVFLNVSTTGNIAFSPRADFMLGNPAWPRRIAAGDIDGDGKIDIVTADNNKIYDFSNNTSHGTLSVSINTSTIGSLSFASPVTFSTGDYSRGIFVADIDGDSKPDIAVANQGTNDVSVFLNQSTTGNINLVLQQTLPIGGNGEQLIMGDIDGDGKIDLIVSDVVGTPLVSVFRNTSSKGSISFAPPVTVATDEPLGISVGDIDGDGKPDIAVANYNTGFISILKNTSSPGNISFAQKMDFIAGHSLVDVKIGDVDGDTIPDLTVTDANDNLVSVLTRKKPQYVLNLGNDTTLCGGDSIILKSNIPNGQYVWNTGATSDKITVTKTDKYYLKVTIANSILNDTINITFVSIPKIALEPNVSLCPGQMLVLNPGDSSANFLWQDGSILPTYTVSSPGTYKVTVTNSCGSASGETTVTEGNCNGYFPSAFTPNSDGVNDVFKAVIYGQISSFQMQIFDRWGNLVFTSNDASRGWNGKLNGIDAQAGAYVWQCSYKLAGKNVVNKKGTVVLIR